MRVLGIGFPRTCSIPTNVSACGDGIHTTIARWGQQADCECDRMAIGPINGPFFPGLARVVLADASMDGTVVGETRKVDGRMVRS